MDKALVEINHLTKSFSSTFPPALKDITATIPKGEIVGLVGPDGAGKTTLLRLIAGLLHPTNGIITVNGFNTVKETDKVQRLIGYMPQKFGLYEDLTVLQNLNLYADLRGVNPEEKKDTFEKLLQVTALNPFTNRLAKDLSGGMKQKLGLACALMRMPDLLLLDEPSVGVDPISRRELWKLVITFLKEGISVIWSTSYLDEAERCETTLLLSDGQLLYYGSPKRLTQEVEGRTFKITHSQKNKRQLLEKALEQTNIIDGVIQGSDVRIVTTKLATEPLDINFLGPGLQLKPTPPRFEDAFMDIMGGGPGGFSALANTTPSIHSKKEAAVVAEHLTKKFGSFTAANDITFSIGRGEIFGLLGPNGAGKSTTFKMMCGLLKPTEGRAYVNGVDLQIAPGVARSHIGYMAQKFSLYGGLSVLQNLEFFSGIYNLTGKAQRQSIEQMIDIFNLNPFLNISADTLPLGYKQRLALSCATMHHPDVLFLDEPTSGVDPITRREFWNHINALVEKGVTVMVTTHFIDEAEYCDRIGLIYKSKMINMGNPDELKNLAKSKKNPEPTLEDAFIKLIEEYDNKEESK